MCNIEKNGYKYLLNLLALFFYAASFILIRGGGRNEKNISTKQS